VAAPFRGEFDLLSAWTLAKAVKKHDIDIIHGHTGHAHTYACLARMLAGRGKVVVSRRVDFPPRRGLLNRWKYSRPDRIIAISNFIAGVLRDYGIEESRLEVVHSVTDASRFVGVEPLPRSALGIPEGVPLLVNVAALVGHKDHATLIDAMPSVLRELPELRLLILGDGELRPVIEAQIDRLGVGRSVSLLGYRKDVPQLLKMADAFVISSKEEGLGSAVIEAMACGLPVVATAAGGIPETVIHEKTGLLVPVGDAEALAAAIVRIFRDSQLVDLVKENIKEQVRRFSVDSMVEGNLAVYRRLINVGTPIS